MATLFYNCVLLRNHRLVKDDLWVMGGIIIDPETQNFRSDDSVDCRGRIIAPGFIDLKLNGAFGVDFSAFGTESGDRIGKDNDELRREVSEGIDKVCKGLASHGVTSFCPTIISTSTHHYHQIMPLLKIREGSSKGAGILGVHADGPFINPGQRGAHRAEHVRNLDDGIKGVDDVFGSLANTKIITMAPELAGAEEVISELTKRGIIVSLGHSKANLEESERAVKAGATMISHLFNAMPNFHHRDPSLLGLLASDEVDKLERNVHFGIIADGVHTHPAALRMAMKLSYEMLVLISDAIAPMGLPPGRYEMGGQEIAVLKNPKRAYLAGTETLFGSVANFDANVRFFHKATGCSIEQALEAASLHPARCLGIANKKGSLHFGADADFVMLDDNLRVVATYILGDPVFTRIG